MVSPTEPVTPSILHLELTWSSLVELCSSLTELEWKTPTGCPGWTVQDNVSHIIDYESGALGRPRPQAAMPIDQAHVRNELGEVNEHGVEIRRPLSGEAVLIELREVVSARASQLRSLTAEDLAHEVQTPAGPGTVADMLTLRVMDTWSHEQDIRRAVGRPGHRSGPAVDEAVTYWSQFLPWVVGRRVHAPDGASVLFAVDDLRFGVRVVDGRGQPDDLDGEEPTVTIAMPAPTFAAHVGGRSDAPDDYRIEGEQALGRVVVANLGFLP
ncbi:MAG TPA: maleylpyruvate isomerase family mycothiol-dependent enzyme [Acidimicrobiales bacterium]|nr:maleylpyruvate isomerase family mycothiol-dependent enzyme [Acidimicrobiales bacterium]